ncbi:UDP-Glycosyltransferase/glycogen phosphorylase [Trametes gibbosa]|nr:UDP-Glycosyltransferase/glycogen phosphorylase [Trametes gibbosa]
MASLKRILFLPLNWWGHARAMCILAARMVRLRPTVDITLFIAGPLVARAYEEVAAELHTDEAHLLTRISFVPLGTAAAPFSDAAYDATFVAMWEGLQAGQPLEAHIISLNPDGTFEQHTTSHSLRDAPFSAAVVDMFMIKSFRAVRSAGSEKLPLYTWMAAATNCMSAWFTHDPLPAAQALAESTGMPFDDAAHKVLMSCEGKVIHSPYLPPMYDHELHPQGAAIPPESCGQLLIRIPGVLRDTDGLLTIDAAEYHPDATRNMRAHFGARPVVYAGPLLTDSAAATERGLRVPARSADVSAFLDRQLEARGARSVLLVSFGTMFWPADPSMLGVFLDVVMEKNIPLIMTCASPFTSIPEDTKQRLAAYKDALLANWLPQKFVLDHSATGWCLTHVGHNSVLECITSGVPMILWPIDGDQAPNAVHLSTQLRVGYELLSVRHGSGRGLVYRTGRAPPDDVRAEARAVLTRAFGGGSEKEEDKEEGAEAVRARLERVRAALGEAWAEGGQARRDVEAFLDGLAVIE